MSLQPRPEIENLKAVPHGGINYAELKAMGISREEVLDFSVSTNPFMPPPEIRNVLKHITFDQYPDSEATEFRQRLSERLGVSPDNIIAGSGTTELIRLIALTYFRPDDAVLIPGPTFGEYEIACRITGARPITPRAREQDNFVSRIEGTIDMVSLLHPRAAFICNPNNPTGKYLPRAEVEAILIALGEGILVLDEAYLPFVEESWPSIELIGRGNVIILRSMTKDYGLAGLRLGYAIANQDIINNMRRVCPPWNVNAVAQKVGAKCLEYERYLEKTRKTVAEAKRFLVDELSRLHLQLLPSDANFFLVKVGDARAFRAALLKRGMMVRDCTSFGLPEYVRIAPRTLPECRKLIAAIKSLKEAGEIYTV